MSASDGDVLRCDLVADYDAGQDIVNTFQYRIGTPSTISDEDVLDDMMEIMTAIVNVIKAIMNAGTIWRKIRVRNLSTGALTGERAFSPTIAGTLDTEAVPLGAAYLVTALTNVPNVRLRKFFGVADASVLTSNGNFTGASQTVMEGLVPLLLNDQAATNASYEYGYLSPKTSSFLSPTAVTVTNIPAYQRRRRPGTGS